MAEMRLWLLQRIGDTDWGEYLGFVVRAPDADAARCEALVAAGIDVHSSAAYIGCDEPWWGDPDQTTCVEVMGEGPVGVILASFKAG